MWKYLFVIFCTLHSCTGEGSNGSKQTTTIYCDENIYSNIIDELILNFEPTHVNLDSSIKGNYSLQYFLDTVNSECLKAQKQYRLFISTILIKQYHFQLCKYHQSFDLLQMQTGHGEDVVKGFLKMCGFPKPQEMLSSGYVMNYLKDNPIVTSEQIDKYKDKVTKLEQ
jgi:hypothetical protein